MSVIMRPCGVRYAEYWVSPSFSAVDVVGEQTLQPGGAIRAGNRENPAIGAPDDAAV